MHVLASRYRPRWATTSTRDDPNSKTTAMTELPTPIHKDPLPQRDWLTVPEAAAIAEVSERTIRAWCFDHHIGRMVGGRWRISKPLLSLIIAGDRSLINRGDF